MLLLLIHKDIHRCVGLSTWSWISRVRERKALELYIEHISRILGVVEHAVDAIAAYRDGDSVKLDEDWRVVYEGEKEADDYKRRILMELSESIFHPIDREEVVRLVITSDDIASYAKAWCRRLKLVRDEPLPTDILDAAYKMGMLVHEAVKLILEASRELLSGNKRRVLELANKIESIEERVDDLHVESLERALLYCDKAKPSHCIIVGEIITTIENAADKREDTADVLRSIALLG
jgi:predicted phosphate transport protein (TIGR00153 family)